MGFTEHSELFNSENNEEKIPMKCGICGGQHFYRDCTYVVITTKVPDKELPTRARLTLPDSLEIKKLADGTESVFSKQQIETGTEFGPFIAKKEPTLNPSVIFPIKLSSSDALGLSEYYLDSTDENQCCWMMFVQPASDVEEQNLICYQDGTDIFFGTIRDVNPGEELKVWYSPYCAQTMQKNTLTFKASSIKTHQIDNLIKEQQKIIPRAVWNCKFCSKLEKNVTDFARHLLTHYKKNERKWCQPCHMRFMSLEECKNHAKICPKRPIMCPQEPSKVTQPSATSCQIDVEKNNFGGPLVLQLVDNSENSNPLVQPDLVAFDISVDNPNLLLDSDNLRLNVEVIEDINPEPKQKESEEEFICDICLKKFSTMKAILKHLRLHTGIYFCSFCKKVFGRSESMKYHKCNQEFTIKCPKCPKLFYQKKCLRRHILLLHERRFACHLCQKRCFSSKELEKHSCPKTHNERKKFQCSACPKQFYSDSGLRRHRRRHSVDTQYICVECNKTFAQMANYKRHISTVHIKSRRYDCKICDKTFSRREEVKRHTQNIHMLGLTKPLKCPTCKKEFRTKQYLQNHTKTCGTATKHTCVLCHTDFKYARNLTKHIKLVHLKVVSPTEERNECPICHVNIKLKRNVSRHIKQMHPETYRNNLAKISIKKVEYCRYKCPICQQEMKLKHSLKRHISNKHPENIKDISLLLDEAEYAVRKDEKSIKICDEEMDNTMDLQKTIENMDFNIDTYNDNLMSGNETIDMFLKEKSDQISILFAESPKAVNNDVRRDEAIWLDAVVKQDVRTEVGLSMPDLLSEIDLEYKLGRNLNTPTPGITFELDENFEPQMSP